MTAVKTYEDGLVEGQVRAIETMVNDHKGRLDNHGNRLRILERVVWAFAGFAIFLEFLPSLRLALGGM